MEMAGALMQSTEDLDVSRKGARLRDLIVSYQDSFTAIEKCSKPVIAAIHSACVGGGVDMVCACDVRFCSADAWFQIKVIYILYPLNMLICIHSIMVLTLYRKLI